MDEARLVVFRSEVEAQIKTIGDIYKKIGERRKGIERSKVKLESLAYQLHNLYCAFEDLFKIVADFFENVVEDKAKYHSELLWRMSIPIEGIRPALLSDEAYRLLDNLRAFRHFFRHAYSYEIELKRVKIVLEDALRLKDLYRKLALDFIEKVS